ncbi:unnamed protein product, partial [Vitis vinifera]
MKVIVTSTYQNSKLVNKLENIFYSRNFFVMYQELIEGGPKFCCGWSDAKLQSSMSRTPNPLTNPPSNPQILSLFNPCKTLRHLKQVHAQIITHHNSPFQLSALASLSALSPFPTFLAYAKTIFHHLQNPPPSLYNSLIRALSSSKTPLEALPLYHTMLQSGLKPDHMTYPFVIKACNESSVTWFGLLVHTHVVKSGFECDSYIVSSLIHLYANGKDLGAAKQLFNLCSARDVVSWNAMIDGYVKHVEMGHARMVFDRMVCRDVISWNTMINGYAICGKPNEALALFDQMRAVGVKPTEATVVSLLSACAHLGALDKGLHLHTYINDNRIEVNSIVGTALVDMYAKCGKISLATQVFNAMESKDVLAWNTIIAGMAIHGNVKEAQQLFKEMKEAGVEPNDITFVAILSACSHAGMVDEGQKLLDCMSSSYGIEPKVEHYGCVIDLLARAGFLEEAMELIGTMPMEPNPSALGALLGGCRIHGNFELGEMVGKRLINLQPCHSGRYILLSNIYAAAKKWDDARKVRNLMKVNGISKVPGVSVIELKGMVHRFVAGDWSHPESNKIYEKLNEIHTRLKSAIGYSADTGNVLLDMEEEDKEHALAVHSEKLAIAYGLLHLDSKEAIRIVKNLRVCRDCHHVIKLISKVYGREIIVRDRNRFHHFEDGECSCLDFW